MAFATGIVLLQQCAALPSLFVYALFPLCIGLGWWRPRWIVACALMLGFLWAMLWAQLRLADELPSDLIGRDLAVTGTVVSIPEINERRIRFDFVIEQHHASAGAKLPVPMKVRLNWYLRQHSNPPAIAAGQEWNLAVRLKPPVGFMNPGGFDYEGWLFSNDIRATGYVWENSDNSFLSRHAIRYAVPVVRSHLLDQLRQLSDSLRHQDILLALALGYRGDIDDQDWKLLLHTGTNHLMSISGLHIGMVAGMLYFLTACGIRLAYGRGWVRQDLWPVQRISALTAWTGALIYSLLAGMSVPTQRSMIMITVGLYALIAYRQLRPAQALCLALLAVLVCDPFAVNSAGFWLSFVAVALLVYTYAGRKRQELPWLVGVLFNWCKVQLVLLIGLLPLTLYWFGVSAITASMANLIAIPVVGFLVVSLVLLATLTAGIYPPITQWLLQGADLCLRLLWPMLEWMQQWPLSRWEQALPPFWAVVMAMMGAILLLAPRGLPSRWLGAFWFIPLLFYTPDRPATGEFFLTALDVGQGTAVVVQTANHSLIYDTGPKLNEEFDTGEMVVLPYLKNRGIAKADVMVISHGDNDHIGGSGSILGAITVDRIISSVPAALAPHPAQFCRDGQDWVWDQVRFSILHPDNKARWNGNDSSCVLLIETGASRVLLTGDIEKRAEGHLLREHDLRSVSILFAPHHGSRTSSTVEFINVLQPQHVIFNAGLFNRYGFPKPEVVRRYTGRGAQTWTVGEQGALEFKVTAGSSQLIRRYRTSARRYWHYQPQ